MSHDHFIELILASALIFNDMIIPDHLPAVGIAHLENSQPSKTTYANNAVAGACVAIA